MPEMIEPGTLLLLTNKLPVWKQSEQTPASMVKLANDCIVGWPEVPWDKLIPAGEHVMVVWSKVYDNTTDQILMLSILAKNQVWYSCLAWTFSPACMKRDRWSGILELPLEKC